MNIDYDQINPGVRRLVKWLNDEGFETTSSGDGVTNVGAEGMEHLWQVPNVWFSDPVPDPDFEHDGRAWRGSGEATRLRVALEGVGVSLNRAGVSISEHNNVVVKTISISLWGVCDADLPPNVGRVSVLAGS